MELPGPSTHPKTQTQSQKFYHRAPRNRQPVQHGGHVVEHAAPPAPYKDLRELLNDKRQNSPNNPPSDPKFNYLSDPSRDTASFRGGGRGYSRPRGNFRGRGTPPRYHNNYKGPPHKYDPNYRHPREQHPPLDPVNISVTYNVEDGLRKCVASNVKLDKNWKKDDTPKEFPKIRRPFSKNKGQENNRPEEIKQEVEASPKSDDKVEASPKKEKVEASPKSAEKNEDKVEASPKKEEVEASPQTEEKSEEKVEASPKNEEVEALPKKEVEASPQTEENVEAKPQTEETSPKIEENDNKNDNTDKKEDIPEEQSKEK